VIIFGVDPGKLSGWCALQVYPRGLVIRAHGLVPWDDFDGPAMAARAMESIRLRFPKHEVVLAIEDQFRANVALTEGGWMALARCGAFVDRIERVSVTAWRARMVGPDAVRRPGRKLEPAEARAGKASLHEAYVALVHRRLRVKLTKDEAAAALVALYVIEERGVGRRAA
jgi:hypothetical protein